MDASKKRFRIEHAQTVQPTDIPKFSEYGIIPSVQPTHATSDMRWAEERLGSERIKNSYLLQSFVQLFENQTEEIRSIPFTLGSDFPVDSVNPLLGIYAAVTRQNREGLPVGGWYPQQKISIKDALLGFTLHPAFASFQEDFVGSISEGNYADFVVLSQDITLFDDSPHQILDTFVVATILGGSCVYKNTTFHNSDSFC